MNLTKYYCDMCGKEISCESSWVSVNRKFVTHGRQKFDIQIVTHYGAVLDLCEDCKRSVASLFGGNTDE